MLTGCQSTPMIDLGTNTVMVNMWHIYRCMTQNDSFVVNDTKEQVIVDRTEPLCTSTSARTHANGSMEQLTALRVLLNTPLQAFFFSRCDVDSVPSLCRFGSVCQPSKIHKLLSFLGGSSLWEVEHRAHLERAVYDYERSSSETEACTSYASKKRVLLPALREGTQGAVLPAMLTIQTLSHAPLTVGEGRAESQCWLVRHRDVDSVGRGLCRLDTVGGCGGKVSINDGSTEPNSEEYSERTEVNSSCLDQERTRMAQLATQRSRGFFSPSALICTTRRRHCHHLLIACESKISLSDASPGC